MTTKPMVTLFCENIDDLQISIVHLERGGFAVCGYNMGATEQPRYAEVQPCNRCFPIPEPSLDMPPIALAAPGDGEDGRTTFEDIDPTNRNVAR